MAIAAVMGQTCRASSPGGARSTGRACAALLDHGHSRPRDSAPETLLRWPSRGARRHCDRRVPDRDGAGSDNWLARHNLKNLAVAIWRSGGAVIGYLNRHRGLDWGPLSVPLFSFSYGLSKGAFLATEAASSLGLYLSKSVTFQQFGAPDAGYRAEGDWSPGSSLMSGRLHRQAVCAEARGGNVSTCDGWHHAGGRPFHVMDRGAFDVNVIKPLAPNAPLTGSTFPWRMFYLCSHEDPSASGNPIHGLIVFDDGGLVDEHVWALLKHAGCPAASAGKAAWCF